MLQMRLRVGIAVKGSITAVVGSGTTSMSEAWIGCPPPIGEPAEAVPSLESSSGRSLVGVAECWQRPRRSRNFKSTASTLLSFANFSTSFGVWAAIHTPPAVSSRSVWCWLNGVAAALASANTDDLVDGKDKDFPVADAARLGRFLD